MSPSHLSAFTRPEVWVHLRTGSWILENRAIPHTGLFSQYSNLAWNDSSWAFDLLLGVAYKFFGLRAIPMLLMLLKAAIAAGTFLLAYSRRGDFWKAVALSALAQYVLSGLQPLPYVFSILFFAIELRLLVSSRAIGVGTQALVPAAVVLCLGQSARSVRSGIGDARSVPDRFAHRTLVEKHGCELVEPADRTAASDSGERNQRCVLSGDVCDALRISFVTSRFQNALQ